MLSEARCGRSGWSRYHAKTEIRITPPGRASGPVDELQLIKICRRSQSQGMSRSQWTSEEGVRPYAVGHVTNKPPACADRGTRTRCADRRGAPRGCTPDPGRKPTKGGLGQGIYTVSFQYWVRSGPETGSLVSRPLPPSPVLRLLHAACGAAGGKWGRQQAQLTLATQARRHRCCCRGTLSVPLKRLVGGRQFFNLTRRRMSDTIR